jgi:hypothetical protein
MAETTIVRALQSAHDGLLHEAREHKREATRARRKSKEAFAKLDELRARCAALGITLVVEGQGDSNGRTNINPRS